MAISLGGGLLALLAARTDKSLEDSFGICIGAMGTCSTIFNANFPSLNTSHSSQSTICSYPIVVAFS